ncbi:MAG: FAD-dependent oxidoreductase [Chloroflexi bacterium]|nr:FAD-dependent oxidoreductase [Chloroflexota bacterium]MBV9599113.1 FAD-dependent oxidoreductase [Chloroflexota bacterium]
MAGLGAAHALEGRDVQCVVYDKNPYYGGHTASFVQPNGFLFDVGPHVSFTKDERIQALFAGNVCQKYEILPARLNNYWHGYWITHPAQCNLYGLPTDLVVNIIRDFVEVHAQEPTEIHNYAEWLLAAYGRTFAETFPVVYGLKYHTTTPDNMATEWLGPRMYRPSLEEVLRGALAPEPITEIHYVTGFRYPSYGGFVSFVKPVAERADVRLCHKMVALDTSKRTLRFANGAVHDYDQVVSSVPLPDLIPCIEDVPADVLEAAGRLAYTTVVMVNLGIDRPDLSTSHISYFYDEDVIFPRLSFPHKLSPHNVPDGMGSIQAELYFSKKYRPLTCAPETLIPRVVSDLHKVGILRESDSVVFQEARVAKYANVIYDLERAEALATVHGFLDEVGIHYCGRYGNWDHAWTDQSFASGERAAEAALCAI